ncbi:MAG TPA: cytochrome c [Longimicrobiaceae bacterium]|nr:cytochrome c [Longimicrobiaceae bacterium]
MKQSIILSCALAAAVLLAIPATGAAQDAGKEVFSTRCSACHQANAQGVPGMYPPLAGSEWVNGDKDQVIRIVLHGLEGDLEVKGDYFSGTMPPWGQALSDSEIAAVLTYVRSNFGNSASAVTEADVAKIRAATASRTKPWSADELKALAKKDGGKKPAK